MKIQERSYSSKVFRPKPFVLTETDGSLIVITTSWGQSEHAALVAQEVSKYVTAARGDVEVTSPFEFLTSISDLANHLRIGTMIANDTLYRGENSSEYISGVEMLAIAREGREIAWAQVGAPHLLISRSGRPIVPLAASFDHSFEINLTGKRLPPLPSRLLGVDPTCSISVGDLQVGDQDKLILLASSILPKSFWSEAHQVDIQSLTKLMVSEDHETPFWLGLIDLSH